MFTGIIEEKGIVSRVLPAGSSQELWIRGEKIFDDLKLGDSVAVNGVCLTVAAIKRDQWMADVMPESLRRSSLYKLQAGDFVNLERAMKADGRFGGHLVSGHIDGVGKITDIKREDNAVIFDICADQKIVSYMIEKGSIAIDGISLTISFVSDQAFGFSVIPHTLKETVLGDKKVGDSVNLENDQIGKYVKKFVDGISKKATSSLTMEFLKQAGF
ncbi:MAG: riboflavin synthase [Eubacteriaceae bacterium]